MFNYKGKNKIVLEATAKANQIKKDALEAIKQREEMFLESNPKANGDDLSRWIRGVFDYGGQAMEVRLYWYYSRNVLGKFEPSRPSIIWLNSRALIRKRNHKENISSIVATLWHEAVHYVDNIMKHYNFGHGSNTYELWKEECAPFYIDWIAEKLANGEKLDRPDFFERTDNTKIKTVSAPIWKRIIFFWRY